MGEIIHRESKSITDNDQEQINISKIIKITSVVSCPYNYYFYNGCGRVDATKIKDFLGDKFSSIVAWYRFTRMSIGNFRLTLRDRFIHKQLQEILETPPDLLTMFLLVADASDNQSTHTFAQQLVRRHSATGQWEKLPMHIPNLSDPYDTYQSAEPVSDTFRRIVKALHIDTRAMQSAMVVEQIQMALQKHAESLVGEVIEKERQLGQLEMEVEALRNKNHQISKMDVPTTDLDEEVPEEGADRGDVEEVAQSIEKRGRGRKKTDNCVNNSSVTTRRSKKS